MNFYNPYLYNIPIKSGTSLFSKLSLTSIINGTSKTLNLINQAIPIIKQASPIMKNAKTMFKVLNEFKKNDQNENISKTDFKETEENKKIINNNLPTFFV